MKFVVADSVSFGKEAFSGLGEVVLAPETAISPEMVKDADAVITRTKTRLNSALLEGSSVKFAGTCTAGVDHVDRPGLEALGITFASAPGCNANGVKEYVLAALLESGQDFRGKTIGIVGHGQVGTRMDRQFTALGCRVLRNDPPKWEREQTGDFVDLETLCAESDVVTLHVPYVVDGPYPTAQLIGELDIGNMRPGTILINACRGEALDGDAAARARQRGHLSWLVLDVFDPEPDAPLEHLAVADLVSPHIAGHSVEGKVNGTRQIREAVVAHFGLDADVWDPEPLMPLPEQAQVVLGPEGSFEERLHTCVRACYDIRVDDQLLREVGVPMKERFTTLRRNYRNRREFAATKVLGLRDDEKEIYKALGFGIG